MIEHGSSEILLLLVLAHLVGDFALQSDEAVAAKRAGRIAAHARHAMLHAVLAYLCAGLWALWLLPLVIGLSHGLIDVSKEAIVRRAGTGRRGEGSMSRQARAAVLLIDQLLHIAVIAAAALFIVDHATVSAWVLWYGDLAVAAAVVLIGLVITTWVGAVVVGFGTEPYLDHLRSAIRSEYEHEHDAEPEGGGADQPSVHRAAVRRGFPKGGRVIGLLERALVFLFVITGNMTGVGFLVAAKGVFRFGEITQPTQRKEAEYILIGTLMSFTWALFASWLTWWVIDRWVVLPG